MKNIEPKTLKGFRDFLPKEAKKRQYVINTLKKVFEQFDFEPLETPALEYEEILLGKYGEEGDKLMYRFTDNGDRKVALRYDQTVPLSRVVAQYQNDLPLPFLRYQVQPVWRAENTQKGRYREFLQFDADIVGSESAYADARVLTLAAAGLKELGFEKFTVLINDRTIFQDLKESVGLTDKKLLSAIRAIDKIKKIGKEAVIAEMIEKGIETAEAEKIMQEIENVKPTQRIEQIKQALSTFSLETIGLSLEQFVFTPILARGLDYYTGLIFEIEIDGYSAGSVCGGGRYDRLIGMFLGRDIPAVGFAYGFDRIMDAMNEMNLFNNLFANKTLVTIPSTELATTAWEIAAILRKNTLETELYLDPTISLDKQFKYADKKGMRYVITPESNSRINYKDFQTGEKGSLSLTEFITKVTS